MIISKDGKKLSFSVVGYQYPDHKAEGKNYDYDANWLVAEVIYTDEKGERTYQDPCLMTGELAEMVKGLSEVICGKESLYISDFMEPYLKITFVRVEDKAIAVGMEFVYDTTDGIWKEHKLAEVISLEKAKEMEEGLQAFCDQYPRR